MMHKISVLFVSLSLIYLLASLPVEASPSPTPTFSPSQIGGLSVWLDAEGITGTAQDALISNWDNAGSGADFSNGSPASQPQYKTAIINSKPVVRFTEGKYLDATISSGDTVVVYAVMANTASSIAGVDVLLASKGGGDSSPGFGVYTASEWYSPTQRRLMADGGSISYTAHKNNSAQSAALNLSQNGFSIARYVFTNVTGRSSLRLGGFTDGSFFGEHDIAEILVYDTDLAQSQHNRLWNYLSEKYDISITSTSASSYTPLTSRNERLKGAMYWPRKAQAMNWWVAYLNGTITESDIRADFAQMKNDLGVNTVRIFLYYDLNYRRNGVMDFTDGNGTINEAMVTKVTAFLDLANEYSLDVLPTMFMEFEYDDPNDVGTGTVLTDNYAHHKAYLDRYMTLFSTKSNVQTVMLLNEPDGYGAWGNDTRANNLLTWLKDLKASAKAIDSSINIVISTSTHDNHFAVKSGAPVGAQSVYALSDFVMFNSFMWADNGYWEYQVPHRVYQYVIDQNTDNKPIVLAEFGWPSHYDDSGVVVSGTLWDKPLGNRPTTPSTPEMQRRAVQEATYWLENKSLDGALIWSAFDHPIGAYRDPFGLIDENGTPRPAADLYKRLFTGRVSGSGYLPYSFIDGDATGTNAKINGEDGTTLYPAGVSLPSNTDYTSRSLPYKIPLTLEISFKNTTSPSSGGIGSGISFISGGLASNLMLRRDESTTSWSLWENGVQVAGTNAGVDGGLGTTEHTIAFDLDGSTLAITVDGSPLTLFVYSGSLTSTPYTYSIGATHLAADIQITAHAYAQDIVLTAARLLDEADALFVPNTVDDKSAVFKTINNMPTGFKPMLSADPTVDTSVTSQRGTKTIRVYSTDDIPVAELEIDFSADRDWSGLNIGKDASKSLMHMAGGITGLPGISGSTFSLLIPKLSGHNAIVICPGASSLSDITLECASRVLLTANSSSVSTVTIQGTQYWKVSGLTGTGGLSYTSTSASPSSSTSSSGTTQLSTSCDDLPIADSPRLFEGRSEAPGEVTLYFVPVIGVNGYTIEYGPGKDSFVHAVQFDNSASDGVLTYTIRALQQSNTWSFRMKAKRGCASGAFSNTLTYNMYGNASSSVDSEESLVSNSALDTTSPEPVAAKLPAAREPKKSPPPTVTPASSQNIFSAFFSTVSEFWRSLFE